MSVITLAAMTTVAGIAGSFAVHPGDTPRAIRTTVGLAAYTFGALILEQIDAGLAQGLALLVLVSVLMWYGLPIAKNLKVLGK